MEAGDTTSLTMDGDPTSIPSVADSVPKMGEIPIPFALLTAAAAAVKGLIGRSICHNSFASITATRTAVD